MSNFRFDASELFGNLAQQQTRFKAAMELYATNSATKLQNYARQNRPWKDNTHDARNRLNADWEWRGNKIVIALSHGVDYGIYLEKGTPAHVIKGNPWLYWQGASHPVKQVNHPGTRPYPIIMPTIEHVGPQITAGLTVFSLGQQDKICTKPFVLFYNAGTEDTSSKNLKKESIELWIFYPYNEYSKVGDYIKQVENTVTKFGKLRKDYDKYAIEIDGDMKAYYTKLTYFRYVQRRLR